MIQSSSMPKSAALALALIATLGGQPAQTPSVVSPEIHPDRTVTFRVLAPKASDAGFFGDWMPVGTLQKMTRNTDGVWSYTTPPLPAGIYIYSFTIDGLTIADPVNPRVNSVLARPRAWSTSPQQHPRRGMLATSRTAASRSTTKSRKC